MSREIAMDIDKRAEPVLVGTVLERDRLTDELREREGYKAMLQAIQGNLATLEADLRVALGNVGYKKAWRGIEGQILRADRRIKDIKRQIRWNDGAVDGYEPICSGCRENWFEEVSGG